MFGSRPKQLFEIPHYQGPPQPSVGIHMDRFPMYLNMDIHFELLGIRPLTTPISDLSPGGITINPNDDVIDYYAEQKTQFQMVFIVVNCAIFEPNEDGKHFGTPYSLCLFPATKRDRIDQRGIEAVAFFDLETFPQFETVYAGFNPFEGKWEILSDYAFVAQNPQVFSDGIGVVVGRFFLALDANLNDTLMSTPFIEHPELHRRFHKFRTKKYFRPFSEIKPRPIWGCESPIELYLFQALLHKGLRPLPQMLILQDGSTYPSYHHMYEEKVLPRGDALISSVDLYFPDQKLAVYCDSTAHHRSKKVREKDELTRAKVRELGIKTVAVSGSDIVKNLDKAVEQVLSHL